jgi:hypothetical protein
MVFSDYEDSEVQLWQRDIGFVILEGLDVLFGEPLDNVRGKVLYGISQFLGLV